MNRNPIPLEGKRKKRRKEMVKRVGKKMTEWERRAEMAYKMSCLFLVDNLK